MQNCHIVVSCKKAKYSNVIMYAAVIVDYILLHLSSSRTMMTMTTTKMMPTQQLYDKQKNTTGGSNSGKSLLVNFT